MREIASKQQLRWAFARWAMVTVPLIVLLGFLSGRLFPAGSDNPWYRLLIKPGFTPPGWLFGAAWTLLYILLGLALAMILNARGSRRRGVAILLFVAQLIVNLVWSPLFFGAHQVTAALFTIVILFVLATATAFAFGRIRRAAGWLMAPYLVWLLYATALNFEIDRLNPNAETLVPSSATTQILS